MDGFFLIHDLYHCNHPSLEFRLDCCLPQTLRVCIIITKSTKQHYRVIIIAIIKRIYVVLLPTIVPAMIFLNPFLEIWLEINRGSQKALPLNFIQL